MLLPFDGKIKMYIRCSRKVAVKTVSLCVTVTYLVLRAVCIFACTYLRKRPVRQLRINRSLSVRDVGSNRLPAGRTARHQSMSTLINHRTG